MKKTKRLTSIILFSIILCVAGILIYIDFSKKGCLLWECAPHRSFDVVDLGLPSDLFPPDATHSPMLVAHYDNPKSIRTGYQEFRWGNGWGTCIYTVDIYSSNRSSLQRYLKDKNTFFSNWGDTKSDWYESNANMWYTPKELNYKSPLADDFYVACALIDKEEYHCGVIARYQEFVLLLHMRANPPVVDGVPTDGMTYERFQKIVIYTDKKISSYLYEKQ